MHQVRVFVVCLVAPRWATRQRAPVHECRYEDLESLDKVIGLQGKVREVADIMHENITKVQERGERIDDINDKARACCGDVV